MKGHNLLWQFASVLIASAAVTSVHAFELSTWGGAVRNGVPIVDIRYRYETVSQDNPLEKANASTIRARLGYKTDFKLKLAAVIEVENVSAIGSERYNSTTNNLSNFSVVADPESTEVNQAYLRANVNNTVVTVGRRRMILDNGRFLGNVGFRQNEQTYDSIIMTNTSLQGHRFIYAFLDKAHRFLGDDNPAGNLEMTSHFMNYHYEWLKHNELSAYAYLLEMDGMPNTSRSIKTFGLRLKGGVPMGMSTLFYALELADQSPYAKGNDINRAQYGMAEVGYRFSNQSSITLGNEIMGGDGTYGFQTPLATAHAFAGDADLFSGGTPPNGLKDRYLKLHVPTSGFIINLSYHNFVSDNDSIDYGAEWDAFVSRKFGKHFTVGLQYADYQADQFAVDTEKAWVWFNYVR